MKKISILVAQNCFGNCDGCYLDKRSGKELTANEILNFARILKKIGYEEITLSGGDPLIRNDIYEIVKGLNGLGFTLHLDTIGKPLLSDDFIKSFPLPDLSKRITLIGIPLDGSTDDICNQFRTNLKGIKDDTLKILQILDSNDFQISINTVVHRGNIDDLQKIYEVITKYPNVIRWELHQFAPLSVKGKSVRNKYEVTEKEFADAISKINNSKNVSISPKLNSRKLNFTYLEFNGDLIKVSNGIKKILFNIRDFSDSEISEKLSVCA
ncbi:MAG: radical SAM protein [Patescibacteria group bacterium]|nr:radical SAM protein [Patescibacteria group bacterium]